MAQHEMTLNPIRNPKRQLQVHAAARTQLAEVAPSHRLGHNIKRRLRPLKLHHRKANPIDADRPAKLRTLRQLADIQNEVAADPARDGRSDLTYGFYDARKHR